MLEALKKIGTFLVNEITKELAKRDKKASGRLLRSFKSDVAATRDGFELFVVAEHYFKFIDEGVNGARSARNNTRYSYKFKKPPLQAMIDFVKSRSIATGDDEVRKAAFAIQYKVWRDGIKGVHILQDILKNVVDNQLKELQNAYAIQISTKIDSILNGTNNR